MGENVQRLQWRLGVMRRSQVCAMAVVGGGKPIAALMPDLAVALGFREAVVVSEEQRVAIELVERLGRKQIRLARQDLLRARQREQGEQGIEIGLQAQRPGAAGSSFKSHGLPLLLP